MLMTRRFFPGGEVKPENDLAEALGWRRYFPAEMQLGR